MKWKDIKKIVSEMSDEQLEKDLIVIACEKTISGVGEIVKCKSKLLYDGDDDPCELQTVKELKENGYDKEDIDDMEVVVRKGEFYIEI